MIGTITALSTVILGLAPSTPVVAPGACVLHEHTDNIIVQKAQPPVVPPVQTFGGVKQVRDAFGTFPNEITSTNFVVKWGPNETYSQTTIDRMLEGFELGWQTLIAQMQFAQPTGTDTYLMNVYIGNTGGNAPTIPDYAGGYADIDGEGYPMMVIHPNLIPYFETPGYEEYGDQTMIHEFFHTVQFSVPAYDLSNETAYWFWEATSEWAAAQALPSSQALWGLIGGYALYPHVALNFYDYPDTGALIELHHYGAGIFAQYLTEQEADWTIIRDAWMNGTATGDPIDDVDALLSAQSIDLTEAFGRFAAHNATWDYARGALIRSLVDYYVDSYPGQDYRIAATIPAAGTDDFVASQGSPPSSYAYNTLRIESIDDADLRIRVRPQVAGSLQPVLVRASAGSTEYLAATENADGDLEILAEGVTAAEQLFLSVAAAPRPQGSQFYTYEYAAEVIRAQGEGDDPVGCVCAVSPPRSRRAPLAGLLGACAAFAFVALRRRQR